MKIAAAAYPPQWHGDWGALAAKIADWVADAAGQGADLLVFPEYGGAEVALIGAPHVQAPADTRALMVAHADAWRDLHRDLAQRHAVHVLAGSLVVMTARGPVNRAWLCGPSGGALACDKLIPTPYERHALGLVSGSGVALAQTALGLIGVSICYDSEFPLLARTMVEAGADLLLVPSCTDFPAGQTRVRQSCRARAIEGQIAVVQAPLVGGAPGCDVVDVNTGRAGIFCPPDHGLPADGIIAQGATDVPGWTCANVDLAVVTAARREGQVGNMVHWPEQEAFRAPVVPQRLD